MMRPMIAVGSQVGSYRVQKLLGQGGMGQVFVAEHVRLGRPVALKVLLPHCSTDPSLVARFFAEARAVNRIRHEHIVEVTDDGVTDDQQAYYVMELLEGESLSERLRRVGRLSPLQASGIILQMADALAATHASGIVHRDLKPDNVFLIRRSGNSDYVKLLDFGIAKLLEDSPVKTQTGAVLGTAYYMSPEQCRGADVDHRTDLYALGIVFYQMLVGQVPFTASNVAGILMKHLTDPCPAPSAQVPGLPPLLEELLLRLVAKDADQRWQTATLLHQALAALMPELGGGVPAPVVARAPSARAADAMAPTIAPTPPPAAVAAAATPPVQAVPAALLPAASGAAPARRPLATLAILAFIFSLFFMVPLFGVVGATLGIVALARWNPEQRGRWMAIASIPIGILGILVVVAIPGLSAFRHYMERSKVTSARVEARNLKQEVRMFQATHGITGCPTIEELQSKAALFRPPIDPWKRPYHILPRGDDCAVVSSGPDGTLGTEDDIEVR
jgi:serine/threonine-protein kinase